MKTDLGTEAPNPPTLCLHLHLWTKIRFSLSDPHGSMVFLYFSRVGKDCQLLLLCKFSLISRHGKLASPLLPVGHPLFPSHPLVDSSFESHLHEGIMTTWIPKTPGFGLTCSNTWRICPRSPLQVSRSDCGVTLSRYSSSE